MDRIQDCVRAQLPVMAPVVPSEVAPSVPFAVTTLLRDNDRGGKRIRRESRRGVSNTPRETQQQLGRNNVLEVDLPGRLGIRNVLSLPSLLLNQFVGNQEANDIVRNGQS